MTAADLAAANPVATLLGWLRAHADVVAAFGSAAHVSGENEAPYPRLRLRPSDGGDDGDLRWLLRPEVLIETYGTLDGTPGQAALRAMHYRALVAATQITAATPGPGVAVVTSVAPSAGGAKFRREPLSGQPVWYSTLIVGIHPPPP